MIPAEALSRRDAVMIAIRRAIVRGEIRPGDRLTEQKLAASMSISRPTVREALNHLAKEGLLVQEPYKPLRVHALDPKAIQDISRTRVALDELAIDSILDDESGARLEALDKAWEKYQTVDQDADVILRHEAHVAFHRAIWESSGNVMLAKLWPAVESQMTIVMAQDQLAKDDPRTAHELHRRLVDAVHSRDSERIRQELVAHTMDTSQELINYLESQEDRV